MFTSRRLRLRKPSPAMLLAGLALFVALGGPASAAKSIKKALFAKEAASAREVDGLSASRRPKPRTLLALDKDGKFPASVGQVGPRGPAGPQGAQGPRGVQGDRGFTGAAGSAIAYSRIFFGPPDEGGPTEEWRADDVFSTRIDNDVNFTRISAGEYCFHDLPFKVSNAVASLGGKLSTKAYSVSVDFGANGDPAPAGCNSRDPNGNYALVHVYDITGAAPAAADPTEHTNEVYVAFN